MENKLIRKNRVDDFFVTTLFIPPILKYLTICFKKEDDSEFVCVYQESNDSVEQAIKEHENAVLLSARNDFKEVVEMM